MQTGDEGKLLCPRNASNNYYNELFKGAKRTSVKELRGEADRLAVLFDGVYDDRSRTPEVFSRKVLNITKNIPISQLKHSGLDTVDIISNGSKIALKCVSRAPLEKGMTKQIHGCALQDFSRKKFVFFHAFHFSYLDSLSLAPVAITAPLEDNDLMEFMRRVFHEQLFVGIQEKIQMDAILGWMAENKELRPRNSLEVSMAHKIVQETKATVELWTLIVLGVFIICLIICTVFIEKRARHLFPFRDVYGEENIIGVWAREKGHGVLSYPNEPSWLVLETREDDDSIILNAYVEEPISRPFKVKKKTAEPKE